MSTMFCPEPPILEGDADPACRACVTVPVRNEQDLLVRCLDALHAQVGLDGEPLKAVFFEVLLLLNNCNDASAAVARQWKQAHPGRPVFVVECTLPPETAHVGTARRLLMDTAWQRLRHAQEGPLAILSTDADTQVAPDWVAANVAALAKGADVVGGRICLSPQELASLPPETRKCFAQDRRYAALVAQLEDLLDPQPGDGGARHLDHFGSSLACTPKAYAAAGGMPAVSPLEDEAFIDRVRRAGLVLRHAPEVRVFTSARLRGRAAVGFAGQLSMWAAMTQETQHQVPSALFLQHRFRTLANLREVFQTRDLRGMRLPSAAWEDTLRAACVAEASCPAFFTAIDCDALIEQTFLGAPCQTVAEAIPQLAAMVRDGRHGAH